MSFYSGKKVLVTGGTGLIGRPLVEMLISQGAQVTVALLMINPERQKAVISSKLICVNLLAARIFAKAKRLCFIWLALKALLKWRQRDRLVFLFRPLALMST